jgi:hypothetical protein
MGRADSPLADRMIFNVGARRSGTFWLQRIVTAHPDVAAVPAETMLFSHGVAPLFERFQHAAPGSAQAGTIYVRRDVLLDAARDFCDRVFLEHLPPGVGRLAERSPPHVEHLDLIGAIYPDARFVHIIRDGRDVARSLTTMEWGPESVETAAREWRESVMAARSADLGEHYVEIRYEDLVADPRARIEALYERLGLTTDDAILEEAVVEARRHLNVDSRGTPVGVGKWRDSFSPEQVDACLRAAGDLLADLGYDDVAPSPGSAPRQAAAPAPRATERAAPALVARLRGAFARATGRDATAGDRYLLARTRAGQRVLRAFLESLHTQRVDQVAGLLVDDVAVRLVDAGGERVARGAEGRDALLAALRDDAAFAGRPLRGDIHAGAPMVSAVLAYEHAGGRAERVLVLSVRGERVAEVALYRLDGGSAAT